jgi:hypothetical protein
VIAAAQQMSAPVQVFGRRRRRPRHALRWRRPKTCTRHFSNIAYCLGQKRRRQPRLSVHALPLLPQKLT